MVENARKCQRLCKKIHFRKLAAGGRSCEKYGGLHKKAFAISVDFLGGIGYDEKALWICFCMGGGLLKYYGETPMAMQRIIVAIIMRQ